jgi:hypothetical protein
MRRRRSPRQERYYIGRRPKATEVYIATGTELGQLAHLSHRSTASFDWGGAGPGALELAFALLADTAGREPTDVVCAAFCDEVVAGLDQAGFVLTNWDIAIWLMTAFSELAISERAQPMRRSGGARCSLRWIWSRLA